MRSTNEVAFVRSSLKNGRVSLLLASTVSLGCALLGCVSQGKNRLQHSSLSAEIEAMAKPEAVDPVREAKEAHLEASSGLLVAASAAGGAPEVEIRPAVRSRSLDVLLQRAVVNHRFQDAGEVAALLAAFRGDAPYTEWLLALRDRLSRRPERCVQRLVDLNRSLSQAVTRVVQQDLAELGYAAEVLQALCAFDTGDRIKGSAAVHRAALLDPHREEHFLAQAFFWRAIGQHTLESSVAAEMLAVVKRPSVAAYLFALETMRSAGQGELVAVTMRRALGMYPANEHLETYQALRTNQVFDGGPTVCDAVSRAYAASPLVAPGAFNHALCLRKQGMQKDAIRVAETALVVAPSYEPLLSLLSGLYAQEGRIEDAARVWRETASFQSGSLLVATQARSSARSSLRTGMGGSEDEMWAPAMSRFLIESLAPELPHSPPPSDSSDVTTQEADAP